MNSNILKATKKTKCRNSERKPHNRLQRIIIEDMNLYELSFDDWNGIDDDMDVSYGEDDDMVIDDNSYDRYDLMDDDSNIDVDIFCKTEFLCAQTSFPVWKMKSIRYRFPNGMVNTMAMLKWLKAQDEMYSLL